MTDREAMQQALEALLEINELSKGENAICLPAEIDGAMDALRTAIEQAHAAPVQEPVAWAAMLGNYSHVSWGKDRPDYPIRYEVPLYTTPPAAPVQDDPDEQVIRERDEAEAIADALAEKIAAITGCEIGEHTSANSPWHSALDAADEFLASHPPAAQRKPLKLREIEKCIYDANNDPIVACRNVEAAHGIKEMPTSKTLSKPPPSCAGCTRLKWPTG